jgi:CRISPR-associated protein Cas5t
MRVLKIVAEGLTTSFRYPHFMQSVHVSFDMPPPATIYGHICSALGEWIAQDAVQFAYHFTYGAKVEDLEHIHVLATSSGKLPGTQLPKVLEGNINPFRRMLLFRPRLVLYLTRPEWESAFRSPRYPVVLGRSQDLFTYTDVRVIELARSSEAYFEHTLAPYAFALQTPLGRVELLPRWLNYAHNREPQFSQYTILSRRVQSTRLRMFERADYWVDPETPLVDGAHLGLFFHGFEVSDATGPVASLA